MSSGSSTACHRRATHASSSWRARSSHSTMCMALRTLPHVVAADGGKQHVKTQFRVGDVAVKYNGKKVAGTMLQGATAEVADVTDFTMLQGRMFTDEEDQRARQCRRAGPRHLGGAIRQRDCHGQRSQRRDRPLHRDRRPRQAEAALWRRQKPATTTQRLFPIGTFHNLHPEDKDMWVSVKYDDQKNKALVEEEIRELLRIRRKVHGAGRRRLRDLRPGFARASSVGSAYRRARHLHDCRVQRRPHGGRRRRHEHHARLASPSARARSASAKRSARQNAPSLRSSPPKPSRSAPSAASSA